tara:strand:+ start:203 stop:730 length:528 start_codon:yes stop_codon:yes gene_type:complete
MKKYLYLKKLLTKTELRMAHQYAIIRHKSNINGFDEAQTLLGETIFYGDPLMESLLEKLIPRVEKELGKPVWPTYSFLRVYNKFSSLKKHTDRPACEISISCTLGRDKDWPLYVGGEKIIIIPGDGLLYYGGKVEHWREEYEGDYQAQVFFHYVEKKGKHADEKFDKRQYLGIPK